MSCYHPLKGFRTPDGVVFAELRRHDILGSIEIPCGQCIGCRMRRASEWSLRCMHEASLWPVNCFVTLTYGRDKLPDNSSLCHRDFQLFLKRARKFYKNKVIRFYMCGEYGPLNQRPHYHACLFNVDFRDDRVPSGKSASGQLFYTSPTLERLWSHGIVSVQDLTPETAGYCARYIMKKALGHDAKNAYSSVDEDGVIIERKPEYAAMSLKPGIGANWFAKYSRDVFPHDFVIQDGVKRQVPKYYDKLAERWKLDNLDAIEYERQKRGIAAAPDNTDDRRSVREAVHLAKTSTLLRNLE
nr:MAG: replication initiator protein [Microvirus sp.]